MLRHQHIGRNFRHDRVLWGCRPGQYCIQCSKIVQFNAIEQKTCQTGVEKLLPNVNFSGYVEKGKGVRYYSLMSSEPKNLLKLVTLFPRAPERYCGYRGRNFAKRNECSSNRPAHGHPIGRPVSCMLGRGAFMDMGGKFVFLCCLLLCQAVIKKMTYEFGTCDVTRFFATVTNLSLPVPDFYCCSMKGHRLCSFCCEHFCFGHPVPNSSWSHEENFTTVGKM